MMVKMTSDHLKILLMNDMQSLYNHILSVYVGLFTLPTCIIIK